VDCIAAQDGSADTAGASVQAHYGDTSGEKSVVSPEHFAAAPQPTSAAQLPQPGVDTRLHSVWVDIIDTSELKFGRRLGELRCRARETNHSAKPWPP
jgi:hypothetical protein